MSVVAWIILLIIVVPMIAVLVWSVMRSSFVRVPSGSLGLLMVKGRATDKALTPGAHFVAALRRHMIELYPSVELSYRADGGTEETTLTSSAPPLTVMLGDRSTVTVAVTVRFRLSTDQLRLVHERFGPQGLFTVVRDETGRAVLSTLGQPQIGVKDLLGSARQTTEATLADAVGSALQADGLVLTQLTLGIVDLGRIGEVVQAISRASYELEREEAEARTRLARARNDAALQEDFQLAPEAAWRYRNPDLWYDLAPRAVNFSLSVPADRGAEPGRSTPGRPDTTTAPTAEDRTDAEPTGEPQPPTSTT